MQVVFQTDQIGEEGPFFKNTSDAGLNDHVLAQESRDTHLVAVHHCSADFNSIAHHHIQHALSYTRSSLSKSSFQ
jgi:hypothetical protein